MISNTGAVHALDRITRISAGMRACRHQQFGYVLQSATEYGVQARRHRRHSRRRFWRERLDPPSS
jgi:hypothetical protein